MDEVLEELELGLELGLDVLLEVLPEALLFFDEGLETALGSDLDFVLVSLLTEDFELFEETALLSDLLSVLLSDLTSEPASEDALLSAFETSDSAFDSELFSSAFVVSSLPASAETTEVVVFDDEAADDEPSVLPPQDASIAVIATAQAAIAANFFVFINITTFNNFR